MATEDEIAQAKIIGIAERNAAEVSCARCRKTVVLTEDGDVQDDGTVEWSGAVRGTCCGLLYAGAGWNEYIDVYDLTDGNPNSTGGAT